MNRSLRIVAILAVVALLLPALVSACPLCKEAEADTPGGTVGFGRGIYYSILLMIAVPWTAVGTVAFLIIRKRRRERSAIPQNAENPVKLVPESPGARS